jgi:hypothetical protein
MTERRANLIQLILTAAIAAALLYRQHLMVLNEDVIWLLVQASRLLDGGRFGTDFIEINTPPALLLYLPAALLQRLLGLSMASAHLVATTAMALGLIAATVAQLRPTLAQRGMTALLWPVAQGIAAAFAVQAYHFGQRDCLVILFLLPFLVLQAIRDKGERPAAWLQGLAGALAALAIAVKPHYAPLLLVLFVLRWKRDGFWHSLLAIDIKALILAAIGLAALSFLLFPEWLDMVRFAWRFYRPEGRSLATLLSDLARQRWPILAVLLIAAALWRGLPKTAPLRPVTAYLFVAAPCLLLAHLLQGRGYAYHLIPFELAVELAALLAIVSVLVPTRQQTGPALVVSLGLMVLSLIGIRTTLTSGLTAAEMTRNPVVSAIGALDRGHGMVIFDTRNTPAIFAADLKGTPIAARIQSLWLLKSAVALADTPEGQRGLEAIENNIIGDFVRYQPDVVVINPDVRLADGRDVLTHLTARSGFAALWRGYRLALANVATGSAGDRKVDIYTRAP